METYTVSEKAQAIVDRATLQAPSKGLGKGWRQPGYKAPNLRHGAIQAIVQASNNGTITAAAALAALGSVPLGSGTPRSFLVAFAACGYLVPVASAKAPAAPAPAKADRKSTRLNSSH